MTLKDKIVVITGSTSGLGLALARECIARGARVIISARSPRTLQRVSREIGADSCAADVTNDRQMKRLAAFAVKKYGRLDVWVNNAGIWAPHADVQHLDLKAARKMMEVNFFGTVHGARAAAAVMQRQRRGTMVNIISTSGLLGRPRSLAYSASKWAARGFTEGLRLELKPLGISVLAVYPGVMNTDIFHGHRPQGYERVMMEPEYVARRIALNLERKHQKAELIVDVK